MCVCSLVKCMSINKSNKFSKCGLRTHIIVTNNNESEKILIFLTISREVTLKMLNDVARK